MDMQKNIELEYRVEIPATTFRDVLEKFRNEYSLISETKRLSYMGFWKSEDKQFDARVRITNGDAEVVLKIGDLHSSDRTELSQPISKEYLSGFARMFVHIAPDSYIAERQTFNFEADNGIVISLVNAGDVCYIEYELLSDETNSAKNDKKVRATIAEHGFDPLDKSGFDALNKKLDACDWHFADTPELVNLLDRTLANY